MAKMIIKVICFACALYAAGAFQGIVLYSSTYGMSTYNEKDGQKYVKPSDGIPKNAYGGKFVQTNVGNNGVRTYFVSSLNIYQVESSSNTTFIANSANATILDYLNYPAVLPYANGFLTCGGCQIGNTLVTATTKCYYYNGNPNFFKNETTWSYHSDLPYSVYDGAMFGLNGNIYFTGGKMQDGSLTNKTFMYSSTNGSTNGNWMEMAPLPYESGLTSFAYFSLKSTTIPVYDRFVVCGGIDGNNQLQSACYMYTPSSDSWTLANGYQLNQKLAAFPIVATPSNFYTFGGVNDYTQLNGYTNQVNFLNQTSGNNGSSWMPVTSLLQEDMDMSGVYIMPSDD